MLALYFIAMKGTETLMGQFLSVNNALGGGLMVNNVSVGCAGYMQILPEVMGDEIVAREHYINILGWPMHP